jgi:competence protein ComGC
MNTVLPPSVSTASSVPRTAPLAVWSLVLGILGLTCFFVLTAVPAVICGHVATGRIKRSGGALGGSGLALAGLITGYLGIAMSLVLLPLMLAVVVPNFVRAKGKAQEQICRMNQDMLDSAKELWSVENKKAETDTPRPDDVKVCLKDNQLPVCPAGGTYTLNAVNQRSKCSVHGGQ